MKTPHSSHSRLLSPPSTPLSLSRFAQQLSMLLSLKCESLSLASTTTRFAPRTFYLLYAVVGPPPMFFPNCVISYPFYYFLPCALSFFVAFGLFVIFLFPCACLVSVLPAVLPPATNHRKTNYPPVHRQNQHPLNQSPIMSTAKTIHPRPVSLINHTLQPLTHHNCTPNHDSKPIYPA